MSGEQNPASKPTPVQDIQGDGRWMSLHHRFVADSKDKEPEVVFIGDSLVQLMHQCEVRPISLLLPHPGLPSLTHLDQTSGQAVYGVPEITSGSSQHPEFQFKIWRELFSPLHALNFGIGGDGTQHVLWRLENGELEHIRPKIVVVWVGTNNHGHTAEQVAGGIKAIVQLVNQRQPQARVVVLGLLPRGQHPNPLREKNRRVNELVRAALAGYPRAHFLDADPGFVHSDGTISHHDMYDYLHLSRLGYTPVCRALHSLLLRLLAQDQGQGVPLPEPTL
uniref:Platelet-activating factor acetylhydrolase IB subunit alpha1 n=1 Tax=Myotis myotis TaxID=51298 RepID=A0A7J7SCP3_MYOMY|nr:platelet activating factor acetylhydrolase 1b catalytic subunit 3 [Myotis myotis]